MLLLLFGCVDDVAQPGVAGAIPELCDGVDNDLDGLVDDDPLGGRLVYADADGDGYGDPATLVSVCTVGEGWVENAADCDDADPEVAPAARELCNEVDDDCDGRVDLDPVDGGTTYTDADGDGYGDASTGRVECTPPPGNVPDGDDCDDTNADVHPGADESCTADLDANCDGSVAYADADGDGAPACEDCDDSDTRRHPGAAEVCDGALDEDCDGATDDADPDVSGTSTWYADADGDGAGDPSVTLAACERPEGGSATGDDCDDTTASRSPSNAEICDAADIDEDCDGLHDDEDESASGQSSWYQDADGDGFGGTTAVSVCDAGAGHSAVPGDCDDADPSVSLFCAPAVSDGDSGDSGDSGGATAPDTGDTGRTEPGPPTSDSADPVDPADTSAQGDTARADTARTDSAGTDTSADSADTSTRGDTGAQDTALPAHTAPPTDTTDTADTADTANTGAAATPIHFVVVGDTGAGDAGQYAVGQGIASVCASEGCDFILQVGDNFYPGGVTSTTDPLWTTAFEDPYTDVDATFWAVMGNHDWDHTQDTMYLDAQVDYTAVSSKWYMPSDYYTRVAGDTTFYGIDTWLITEGAGAPQESWLASERASSTTAWNIVFGHHPYISNGPHGNASGDLDTFMNSYVCGEFDVYFCGHDHNLQWLEDSCDTTFIVSGGGHSTYPVFGLNPSYFQVESLGFVWVEIDGDTFTGVFYDQDGVELYRGSMTR